MDVAGVNLLSVGLPLAILAVVAAGLAWGLVPRATRSQGRVALGVAVTAVLMLGVSGAVMALFDGRRFEMGAGAAGAGLLAWFYVKSGLLAVVAWGPVLVFMWLGLAQRVERLKGEDVVRGEG